MISFFLAYDIIHNQVRNRFYGKASLVISLVVSCKTVVGVVIRS